MNCPHCKEQISVLAMVPDEQIFYMALESQAEHFSAETIGGVISNTVELLKSAAESAGGKVAVFLQSVEMEPHKVKIGFFITGIKQVANAVSENPAVSTDSHQ